MQHENTKKQLIAILEEALSTVKDEKLEIYKYEFVLRIDDAHKDTTYHAIYG